MHKKFFPDREFKALLFDFDGTVADTMPAHFAAWNHALDIYDLKLTVEQHQSWAGRPTREIVRLLSEQHGKELSYDEISKAKEAFYLGALSDVVHIVPVFEVIRAAYGQLPMAIVSGSRHKPVETTLRHLNMSHFFKELICAEDYVNGKPAPDCFLTAARRLGVEPQDCLVFEDAELGIAAARAAGMAYLRVSHGTQPGQHEIKY